MKGRAREALLARIAPLDVRSSAEVLQWLDEQRQDLKEGGTVLAEFRSLDSQLSDLSSLLHYLVTGEYRRRSAATDPVRTAHRTQSFAEPEVAPTKEVRFAARPKEGVDTGRALIDVAPNGERHHQRSLPAQRHRARVARSQIVRGYMMSPSRWGVLSTDSLDGLVENLYEGLSNGNKVDALLLTALLTGRRVFDLKEQIPSRADASLRSGTRQGATRDAERAKLLFDDLGLYLRIGLKLPRLKVEPNHRRFYAPSGEVLELPLPDEVDACLKRGDRRDAVVGKTIRDRLATLRNRFLQVTEARIRSAGRLWLYHHGEDRTTLDRLYGTDLARAVPLYYENMRVSKVLGAYQRWAERLNQAIGCDALTFHWESTEARVGSWRTPVREVLATELSAYRRFVDRRLRRRMGSPQAHNHYAAYTYLLLSMATGIRPVRQPFETFDDFCEQTGVYYLQDKDIGGTESPRYVIVADFGVRQLEFYRSYLSRLVMHLEDEDQCRYVEAALNGNAPFLFTLEDCKSLPAPLSPKRVSEVLGERLPIDLYSTRHLLRTELIDRGVGDDVVQAFMGHGEMGQEPFARYSALSMKDLQFVSRKTDEMARSLVNPKGENDEAVPAIEPLRYAPLNANRVPLGRRIPTVYNHVPQRDFKQQVRLADTVFQQKSAERWVNEKMVEARKDAKALGDPNQATAWEKEMMDALEKAFPNDKAWRAARELLPKELERLNREMGTAIPIRAAPRYPPQPRPMHDLQTFQAHRSVQRAASAFSSFINNRARIAEMRDRDVVPLVLFSAACFGGLAEPRALFAFGQMLRSGSVTLNSLRLPDRQRICWLNLQFATNRSNNLLVDRKPVCLRRFFVDGMTLILLMHHFERDVPASKPYRARNALVVDIRNSLRRLCGEDLIPGTMTLNRFCRGAIGVAESLPGVELPHYIVEYATGLIDSVSLPEDYFLAYLGKRSFPGGRPGKTVRLESRKPHGHEAGMDPELDGHIRAIRDLFAGLRGVIANRRRAHVVSKLRSHISESTSENARLLAEYFLHLLERSKRPVQPMTPARYSNWISKAWLLEFEGIDLKSLDEEEWFDKYEAIVEQAAPHARADLACRLMDFHRYLSEHHGLKPVPTDLAGLYRRVRLVRARAISETQFAAFIAGLGAFVDDPEDRACLRWLFTLCFRLGARIGEASQVRFRDIERTGDPMIFFRANRFGNTKTRSPHQLRLHRFLTDSEKAAFRTWRTDRRVTDITENDELPLFSPAGKPDEVWDTRSLASLFTTVMYEVAGIHYSPHACRHSFASRLLWLAEDEMPPDGNPFDDKALKRLKSAVFTAAPRCRDRIWHLSAVFNHADPGTTLGSYVHFLDWMLYRKISASEREIDIDAFFELTAMNQEEKRLKRLKQRSGARVEDALSLVYPSRKARFNSIRFRRRTKEARYGALPPMSQTSVMDRFRYVQPVLRDLEDEIHSDDVAARYGQEASWVRDLHRAAATLADVRTARGRRRYFQPFRSRGVERPLYPAPARGVVDLSLDAAITLALRRRYLQRPSSVQSACEHWFDYAMPGKAEIPFYEPAALHSFLEVFADVDPAVLPLEADGELDLCRPHWVVMVWSARENPTDTDRDGWRVFPALRIRPLERSRWVADGNDAPGAGAEIDWRPSSERFPNGIAYLYLDKGRSLAERDRKNASRALKSVLFRCSVILHAEGSAANDDGSQDRPK